MAWTVALRVRGVFQYGERHFAHVPGSAPTVMGNHW